MVDSLRYIEASEVETAEDFATYCQQRIGVPYPTYKQRVILKAKGKEFFATYPLANWQTMVRVAEWANNNNQRVAHSYSMFSLVRYAWKAGYTPELDPRPQSDEKLEKRIASALRIEKDAWWRDVLMGSEGITARREVYAAWWAQRGERGGS